MHGEWTAEIQKLVRTQMVVQTSRTLILKSKEFRLEAEFVMDDDARAMHQCIGRFRKYLNPFFQDFTDHDCGSVHFFALIRKTFLSKLKNF